MKRRHRVAHRYPKPKRRRLRLRRRTVLKKTQVVARAAPAAPPPAPKEVPPPAPAPSREKGSGKRQILLCPGPVVTSQHVRSALLQPDMCHREPEFANLLQNVRAKLLHVLGLDGRYIPVILTGSGTAALEAAVMASVEPGKKLLVINNGVYGSRIAQAARIHEIPLVEIRSPLTERPDLNRVVAAMKREPKIGTVAMVHHETSTGLLNPVAEVGALTKQYKKKFLVDAISSLGAERLDLVKSNVTFCVGSSGKCFHGLPGLSFVLVAQSEVPSVMKARPRSLYLDLGKHLKAQESGEPPFTPAVPLVIAFHAALDELLREGLKSRMEKYQERAKFLREGFHKMGLSPLLDEKIMSNSLTSLLMPKGLSYQQLHHLLKRHGFVIYAGQSELRGRIFRVAHMGQLLQADLKEFLRVLKESLERASAS
ncbi:MAG: alanine--glyoxylate aminotransferase family protein [Candidatus Omnitrophica bacterium]|nr:alanine--glyoxylate aminotransferase family protein [Candidatus Omnitrophota bacterium]